jgi:hypothetical protein
MNKEIFENNLRIIKTKKRINKIRFMLWIRPNKKQQNVNVYTQRL